MKRARQRKQARRPMSLRHETKRQLIARLLLLGWTAERIGETLGLLGPSHPLCGCEAKAAGAGGGASKRPAQELGSPNDSAAA